MKATVLASVLLAGCFYGSRPTPPAAGDNPAAPATRASQIGIEAHLPADAVLIWYEAESYVEEFPSLPTGRCLEEANQLASGYTMLRPDGERSQYMLGKVDRELLTRCLLDAHKGFDPATRVTEQGNLTTLSGDYSSLQLAWHKGFVAIGVELAPPGPPPSAERLAALRGMREAEVAMWTTLPVVRTILGVEAKELSIEIDKHEMPAEWMRQVSGTITVQFASSADAAAAKAALASGKIATLTDPKLVAALQSLPVEVVGATLRARLTDLKFSLRDLLDQLGSALPVLVL